MTVAMLQGPKGPQAAEGQQLVQFLSHDLKPDVICFSNVMLCAEVERLKTEYSGPVFCTLQGDDIFLNGLNEPHRSRVHELLKPITRRWTASLCTAGFMPGSCPSSLEFRRSGFIKCRWGSIAANTRGGRSREFPAYGRLFRSTCAGERTA